jgi:hypothetical protein
MIGLRRWSCRTPSSAGPSPTGTTPIGMATYEIRVEGHLDDHWAATLDHLLVVHLPDGTTSLTGPVVDQAQLHGVLARIRDIGVPLLLRTLDGLVQQRRSGPTPDAAPAPEQRDRPGPDPPAIPVDGDLAAPSTTTSAAAPRRRCRTW